jgi:chlorobactene glucosyltransferase
MSLFWHVYAILIILFLVFGLAASLINFFTVRRFDQYPPAKEYPFVSVLIPARNEEHTIGVCLSSLLSQDYPDFEVIVLNDNSTDDTSRILEKLAEKYSRLRVIQGAPLPEGWLGKHWACHQLYLAAKGELFLFTDADTCHTTDMLRTSVSALIAEQADLVSAFPQEEMVTWGERLLVPIMCWGIFTFIPIRLVQKMHWALLAISIGQFMLFRRSGYELVGGFERVRTEVVDDVCMGRILISKGGEWRLLDGTRQVSCRMYHGFREAVGGFSKTLFAVFDYRILPYIISWLLTGLAFLGPVVGLILYLLRVHLTFIPVGYAAISVLLSIITWIIISRRFHFPIYIAFLYPLDLALYIIVAAHSFVRAATGTAVWKNRVLNRVPMRWL